LAQKFRPRACV